MLNGNVSSKIKKKTFRKAGGVANPYYTIFRLTCFVSFIISQYNDSFVRLPKMSCHRKAAMN